MYMTVYLLIDNSHRNHQKENQNSQHRFKKYAGCFGLQDLPKLF